MTAAADGTKPYYYVPQPSHWPITGSFALLLMGSGAAFWFNGYPAGPWMVATGFCVLLFMLFGWFGTVIGESEGRLYNKKVDLSFRWGMSWFIFSEVMFFAAFFGALFYIRNLSVPGSRQHRRPSCCGRTTRRSGRPTGRTRPRSSRRWVRWAFRSSTRSSCSRRA